MKNAVLIPSAIMIQGSETSRFMQTLHTIDSVFQNIPNASIFIIECSVRPLEPYMKSILEGYNVTLIEMLENDRVHEVLEQSKEFNNGIGFIKNLTEIHVINHVLNSHDFSEFDRICKVSGRYILGPTFNWSLNKENSFTTSVNYYSPRYKDMFAKQCTYWSLPYNNLEEYKTLFRLIEKWLIQSWEKNIEYDIEHGLWVFLNQLKIPINEVHPLGVIGLTDGKTFNMH